MTGPEDILGSGIAFPLGVDRRGGLGLAHGEQDVDQAIAIVLGTAPGERPMRPDFGCGVHDYVFERVDQATLGRIEHEIRVALDRWEPRIDLVGVTFDTRGADRGELLVHLTYRLRASNHVRNLVHPFYVIPDE